MLCQVQCEKPIAQCWNLTAQKNVKIVSELLLTNGSSKEFTNQGNITYKQITFSQIMPSAAKKFKKKEFIITCMF